MTNSGQSGLGSNYNEMLLYIRKIPKTRVSQSDIIWYHTQHTWWMIVLSSSNKRIMQPQPRGWCIYKRVDQNVSRLIFFEILNLELKWIHYRSNFHDLYNKLLMSRCLDRSPVSENLRKNMKVSMVVFEEQFYLNTGFCRCCDIHNFQTCVIRRFLVSWPIVHLKGRRRHEKNCDNTKSLLI